MTTGPWKDACRAVNVRFVKVTNLEAVVGVVNAGEAPSEPRRCVACKCVGSVPHLLSICFGGLRHKCLPATCHTFKKNLKPNLQIYFHLHLQAGPALDPTPAPALRLLVASSASPSAATSALPP